MASSQDVVLDLLNGRWRTQTLHAGVKLGCFEAIGGEPRPTADVARELGLNPALAYRLLRALGSLGMLEEHPGSRFSAPGPGELLRSDHPRSLRDVILLREGREHTAVWKQLPAIVRDGKQNGFEREFGVPAFEYAAREPEYAAAFDAGMSSHSRVQTEWVLEALREFDFSSISHICDVAGGQGHLLGHLLLRHPHLAGTVLERPGVLANPKALWAEKLGVGDRCRYVAGDMFVDVPAADAYSLKMILHDWDDEECVQILGNLHRRAPRGGRVFVVEHVIPDSGRNPSATLFDIHMMCWGTGRERTEREYAQLLREAGWEHAASRFPQGGAMGVIEGAKA